LDDTVLSTRQQVDTFLTTHELHLETELKLDPSKLPFPADANALVSNIQQCRNKAQNDSSVFLACMAVDSGPASGKEAVSCAASNTKAQDIVTCLANATQSPQLSRITGCIKGDNQDPKQTVTCLLNDEDKANVEKMEKCLRDASSAQTALETCPEKFLPDDQKKKIRCITAAGTNASAVASCALPSSSDAQTAIRALNCAHDAASTAAAAQCLAAITGGEAGRLAECVTPDGDRASTIACMLRDRPELSRAQTLYKCASGGTDTASLIANCSDGILDERSQQIAKCIAQQGSDRNALAGCAASTILPKEFGPAIRCASESTGGADFAVCMAGPVMNEEWRIAAECAVETGGAPPAFAVCAAGRLTVKELTKCLSGQIGTEGGCFGPHNTIVEAFATVGHDLGNCLSGGACLGPNNEIVKAAKAIEEGVSHLGHEGERIWHGLFGRGSHWCRGDLTRWTC
jgi:hypothetical protein